MNATRKLLEERGVHHKVPDFDMFWRDFHAYTRHKHAHGHDAAEILAPVKARLNYDIEGWLAAGSLDDPTPYKYPQMTDVVFRLSEHAHRDLESALAVWSTHIRALSKLVTRINVDSQVRECVATTARTTEEAAVA
jgi:hypothetical protein